MRKFIGFFTLLALFLCANSAFCAQPRKITLQQAIDIAVQNNIDYKAAQIDVEIAKNNIKSANKLQPTEINTFFNIGSIARGNPQMLGATQGVEIAKRDARKKLAESCQGQSGDRWEHPCWASRSPPASRESYTHPPLTPPPRLLSAGTEVT